MFCLMLVMVLSMMGMDRDRGEEEKAAMHMVEFIEGEGVATRKVEDDSEDEKEDTVQL